ncbi:MAG: MFS transporter [Acidocella sp. 20-63-7]|nr:MAG: MFS transporter [Acidocella sp. 20-63-7]HQT47218.1 MFS transporter [Acidocella sp.]
MTGTSQSGPSRALVGLLAASCGIIVANIYYAQPLVGLIGPALGMAPHLASLIVSLTQLGYAAGLLLLVPLGDLLETRRLVMVTLAASIPALLLAGFASNSGEMLAAGALIGLTSVAVQMLVPLAAHLAPEARRGRVVGNVMSGLLLGILLARPVSSVIAAYSSWRVVFFVSAGVMVGMILLLRATLPVRQPTLRQGYAVLLATLFALPFRLPVLRQRAAYQAAAFGCFSLFWTGAPLLLMQQFGYTQRGIAVFALVGAAGALAAPIAGRLADRGYGGPGAGGALVAVALAFVLALAGGVAHSVALLALAGVVLDAGVQASLAFGQRIIFVLAPELRSRLNGMFMALFFAGGAAGSALTSPVLVHFGWSGICALGVALPLAALGYFAVASRGQQG